MTVIHSKTPQMYAIYNYLMQYHVNGVNKISHCMKLYHNNNQYIVLLCYFTNNKITEENNTVPCCTM